MNESTLNRNSDFIDGVEKDITFCEIDEWFDYLVHDQVKRSMKNGATTSKAHDDVEKLNHDLKLANESTPQHDINELANQFFCLERLHQLHEEKKIKKCMLSACLHMTKDFRQHVLKYIGLDTTNESLS